MRIAFFEMQDEWEKEYLKKNLKNHKLYFYNSELNRKNVEEVKNFDILCVFIYSKLDQEIISKLNVKAIITRSTGFDHINLNLCGTKKIKVFNVPKYGSNTVAEYTFALILALARKIVKSNERVKTLNFNLDGLEGFDLKNKIIGIVGLGEIGVCVAEIAKGFGMKILVYTPKKDMRLAKKIGLRYVNFNSLLKKSDIITFHVPLLPSTTHMINLKNIDIIKRGSYLINTSRGGVVETEAILKALNKKILAGAGLDVLEEEELIKDEKELLSKNHSRDELKRALEDNTLIERDNVIITPHNAFNTKEALERILDITIRNINSVKSIKGNVICK